MAVPARKLQESAVSPSEDKFSADQILAAQLLAQGYSRPEVAKRLFSRLTGNMRGDKSTKLKGARNKIRKWQRSPKFQDLIYHYAVGELDQAVPQILQGIARKAAAGRVDAARLALEITGRHAPNTDVVPAQIVLNFGGTARPESQEEIYNKRLASVDGLRPRELESEAPLDAEWEEALPEIED